MSLVTLAVWARKIHRFLVIFVTLSGFVMMITGTIMHKNLEGEQFLPFINPITARAIHGSTSTIFTVILSLTMFTGLFLYIYPWLSKHLRKTVPAPPLH